MKLIIKKTENVLVEFDFYNQIFIPNLELEGTPYCPNPLQDKKNTQTINSVINVPYSLICYLDLSECPKCLIVLICI